MKNLLFTLVLLFTFSAYSQIAPKNVSNPVSDSFILLGINYAGSTNHIEVPDGKFWTIGYMQNTWNYSTTEYYAITDAGFLSFGNGDAPYLLLPAGSKLWSQSASQTNNFITIMEHNYNTSTSLSSTDVELPNQIRLFPNPTTSEVALNSDKQYDIEVYDILGNKVMELTGNTIDMEHLSSATYIVNALDTETNERLSYKVIKN